MKARRVVLGVMHTTNLMRASGQKLKDEHGAAAMEKHGAYRPSLPRRSEFADRLLTDPKPA